MKLENTLKTVFEGMDVLDDSTKEKLTTTFAKVLEEAKVEQEKTLRAEMSAAVSCGSQWSSQDSYERSRADPFRWPRERQPSECQIHALNHWQLPS